MVQLCDPVRTSDPITPWTVNVGINGRPHKIPGEDPVCALAYAAHFVSQYLSRKEGLDPPVDALPRFEAPPDSAPSGEPAGKAD